MQGPARLLNGHRERLRGIAGPGERPKVSYIFISETFNGGGKTSTLEAFSKGGSPPPPRNRQWLWLVSYGLPRCGLSKPRFTRIDAFGFEVSRNRVRYLNRKNLVSCPYSDFQAPEFSVLLN